MEPRTLASLQASSRIAFGAALALAPSVTARAWVGRAGRQPGAHVIATAMGARDAALGAGILAALRGGQPPGPWLRAATFSDLADLLATLRARDALPTGAVVGVTAIAAGSAALGVYLDRALGQPVP
jgi:hypothetical protein